MKTRPLLLLGLLVAAASCAQIIGIEHYEVPVESSSPGWTCVVPEAVPLVRCVSFTEGPDGTEGDAGLDDTGVASRTTCDPVTNIGCSGDDVCVPDADATHYFCGAGAGNPVPTCGVCDALALCGPGTLCLPSSAICLQMCCVDADCGAGHCDFSITMLGGGVGLCVQ